MYVLAIGIRVLSDCIERFVYTLKTANVLYGN